MGAGEPDDVCSWVGENTTRRQRFFDFPTLCTLCVGFFRGFRLSVFWGGNVWEGLQCLTVPVSQSASQPSAVGETSMQACLGREKPVLLLSRPDR